MLRIVISSVIEIPPQIVSFHLLFRPDARLVGALGDGVGAQGVGDQDQQGDDRDFHGGARVSLHEDGDQQGAQHGPQHAQGGDAGAGLHTAEGIGHLQDADGARQGKDRADGDQHVSNDPYDHFSLPPSFSR